MHIMHRNINHVYITCITAQASYSYIIMLVNKNVTQTILAYHIVRTLTWLALAEVLPNLINVSSCSSGAAPKVVGS